MSYDSSFETRDSVRSMVCQPLLPCLFPLPSSSTVEEKGNPELSHPRQIRRGQAAHVVGNRVVSASRRPGLAPWLCHLLAV